MISSKKSIVVWNRIGPTVKIGLALIGVLYVVGFFVVLIHQSQYGIYSSDILRTRYILVGCILISPLVLIAYIGKSFLDVTLILIKGTRELKTKKWIREVLDFVGFAIGLYVLFRLGMWSYLLPFRYLSNINVIDIKYFEGGDVILKVFLFLFLLLVVIISYKWIFNIFKVISNDSKENQISSRIQGVIKHNQKINLTSEIYLKLKLTLEGIISPIIIILYVTLFAQNIYPKISEGFGGGHPVSVGIVTSTAFRNEFVNLAKLADSSGVIHLYLVAETDRSLYLVLDSNYQESIEIPRSQILACFRNVTNRVVVQDSTETEIVQETQAVESNSIVDTLPRDSL